MARPVPNRLLDVLNEFEHGGAKEDSPDMWGRVHDVREAALSAWKTEAEPPSTDTPDQRMRSIVVRWRCGGFGVFPAGWFAAAIHDRWAYLDDVLFRPEE